MPGRQPDSETNSRLVYSTEGGRVRATPHNRRIELPAKAAAQSGPAPSDDGVVRIHRDRKGRGGKTASVVTGLPGTEPELDALLKRLKSQLGTGGAREGRSLVIQGDHRDRLLADLTALGHQVKLAGG
jgi:translation initiation factor 1